MKKYVILSCAVLLSACDSEIGDLEVFIAEVQATTPVVIEPYPEFKSMPAFAYAAQDLRSPFQHPRNTGVEIQTEARANCAQPTFSRTKQALEKYGSDALSVTGTFTSNNKKWALIQTNSGSLHKVTVGDYLGLFYGKIDSIQDSTVFYTEMLPDGAGCWKSKPAKLTMLSKAGEKDV
ncbi:MAG: type IV pilus assembly protein PilP [Paraglaciecola sp.]|jgi:type IV pilus assembly protein PilP